MTKNDNKITKEELIKTLEQNSLSSNLIIDNLEHVTTKPLKNVIIPISKGKTFESLSLENLGISKADIEKYGKMSEEVIAEQLQALKSEPSFKVIEKMKSSLDLMREQNANATTNKPK